MTNYLDFESSYFCAQTEFVIETFTTSVTHDGKFNAIYSTCITCIEGEIHGIMWRGIFCANKPYFLMPGHII